MGVQLRLPDVGGLPEVVIFHREDPTDLLLVLQVPNPGATDSETYRIRLDKERDRAWMRGLKNSRHLQHMLKMEMHIAYEPTTGTITALPDADAVSPLVETFHLARAEAAYRNGREESFRRRTQQPPAMSRHRMRLMGRFPGMLPQGGRSF